MNNPIVRLIKSIVFHGLESLGRYYSSYRGFVVDVDDPEGLQRLKLSIPQITGTQSYNYWAMPKSVFFGKGYGSQVLPKVGDLVWVEFEGGHPEVPIWSHGHPGRKEYPKDSDLQDVNCYWLMTPKGNLIKLYDTKNVIDIKNSLGHYLEINENGHSLVTSQHISLGTLNTSKEPAVLGDTAMDLLNDFIQDLGNLDFIETSTGVTGKISSSPLWEPLVEKWKNKWEDFKSKKVTLD